jgi:hypothetical protein
MLFSACRAAMTPVHPNTITVLLISLGILLTVARILG